MDMKKGFKRLEDFGLPKVEIAKMFGTNTKMLERISSAPSNAYVLMKNVAEESSALSGGLRA